MRHQLLESKQETNSTLNNYTVSLFHQIQKEYTIPSPAIGDPPSPDHPPSSDTELSIPRAVTLETNPQNKPAKISITSEPRHKDSYERYQVQFTRQPGTSNVPGCPKIGFSKKTSNIFASENQNFQPREPIV